MYKSALALLTGLCAVSSAVALPQARNGTGSQGFLTVDDRPDSTEPGMLALASNSNGEYYSCLADTTATVSDCAAVIGDIRANHGPIKVAAGFCLNWYEGGCLGRVCGGREKPEYNGDASWIADQMAHSLLKPCVAKGWGGAVADCKDVASTCGTYHLSLQTYDGGL
ncbi:hypothetical protein GGR52DRAFT_453806 [Hypoxylon sp. FL1284]|nr:hypothetical protein GGR52DRAFT_453806 [Hypoxylon sp. FL1284]